MADLTGPVAKVSQAAQAELANAFSQLVNPDATAVREALSEILPGLVDKYGTAAATMAADWYDKERLTAGVAGAFEATVADLPGVARTDALAGWAVSPLFQAEADRATTLTKLNGGLQRIVANAARETVMESSVHDPHAHGWRRVGRGANCDFCNMLLGRGAVYTEMSSKFKSHDHCNCGAEPAWDSSKTTHRTPKAPAAPVQAPEIPSPAPTGPPPGLPTLGSPELAQGLRQAEAERRALEKTRYNAKNFTAPDGTKYKKGNFAPEWEDGYRAWESYTRRPTEMNLLYRDPAKFAQLAPDASDVEFYADKNQKLADIISAHELQNDVTLARGVTNEVDFSHLKAGDALAEPAFLSTTSDLAEADRFATSRPRSAAFQPPATPDPNAVVPDKPDGWRFIIQAPKGTNAVFGDISQSEVILGPGTKQTVLHVDLEQRVVYTQVVK